MTAIADPVLLALLAMQRKSWEQGVCGQALLDLGRYELVRVVAEDAVLRQSAAGRLAEVEPDGPGSAAVNCAANAECVAWAARATGEERYAAALRRQLAWLTDTAPRAGDGTLYHLDGVAQVWVDSVYMVLPALVLAGAWEEAMRQLAGHRHRLWHAGTGLYAHIWREDTGELTRAAHWGTGNGWVAAGLARTLRLAGQSTVERQRRYADHAAELAGQARALIDACLTWRRADGLFTDVLDEPDSFGETNAAQMLAYAAFTGVADGWLPPRYADTAGSLLAAATAKVDGSGLVRGACGSPHFSAAGVSPEGQAFHLLARAAADRVR